MTYWAGRRKMPLPPPPPQPNPPTVKFRVFSLKYFLWVNGCRNKYYSALKIDLTHKITQKTMLLKKQEIHDVAT